MLTLTLRAIDGEAGVVLPQEALARLDVKLGDTVVLGSIRHDPRPYRVAVGWASAHHGLARGLAVVG